MNTMNRFRAQMFILILILIALSATACGTLEVGIERSATPPVDTAVLGQQTTEPGASAVVSFTGVVQRLDFPTGVVELFDESQASFANADGIVIARIGEWTQVRDANGAVVAREDVSRGAQLEISGMLQEGALVADHVVILREGVSAENNPANIDASDRITPLPEAPSSGSDAIDLFEVSSGDSAVEPGATIMLRWAFAGESGSICERINPQPLTDTCFIDLPASGSLDVTVPVEARGTASYGLSVQANGQVESAFVLVPLTIDQGCAHEWFFDASVYPLKPMLECALDAPMNIVVQAQRFEQGLMIRLQGSWLGEDAYVIPLFHEVNGEYHMLEGPLADIWTAGMPEIVPGETPPADRFQPSRGFGLLWNGLIEIPGLGESRTFDSRAALGWATVPVFEYQASYQCRQGSEGRAKTCFLNDPDGGLINLPSAGP